VSVQGKHKTFIALLLILLLINPMLVKSLHRHQDDHRHCNHELAEGLNSAHHHHYESCEICSFEYFNLLFENPRNIQVNLSDIRVLWMLSKESARTSPLFFASLRAPPHSV
jgi:hypothetical protein